MLMVNGASDSPFDGVYKYLDALHHGTPVAAACAAGSPMRVTTSAKEIQSGTPWTQPDTGRSSAVCASVSATSRQSRHGSMSMSLQGSHSASSDGVVLVRGSSSSPSPLLEGGGAGCGARGGPRLAGFMTDCRATSHSAAHLGKHARLRLLTEPGISTSFRRLRIDERDEAADFKIPPLAVAVSMSDVVDEQVDSNPMRVARLRAMATNWASANRCRVTFVSNKSGSGVSSALAHLISLVYEQDRQSR